MKTFTSREIEEIATRVNHTISSIMDMISSYRNAKQYFSILSDYLPEEYEHKNTNSNRENLIKSIYPKAWIALLYKTGILNIVTKQRYDTIYREAKNYPREFNEQNITIFLQGLKSATAGYILESIEFLKEYIQGSKLVIPAFIENLGTNHERNKIVNLLVNIVYYQQSRELNELYDNEITEAIKMKRIGYGISSGETESENFKLKWYGNGNLHITVKDARVWKNLTA